MSLRKKDFEEGNFNPIRKSDAPRLENVAGTDLFVSQRLLTPRNFEEQPTITLEFIDGLPIPPRTWSYKGILDFKRKHYSEYRAFWNALYLIAADFRFINHPDPQTQIRKEIIEALDEFATKSAETFGTKIRDSISFDISPLKTGGAMSAAAIIDTFSSSPVASIMAGMAGILKMQLRMKPSYAPMSQNARAMSYLSRIRNS